MTPASSESEGSHAAISADAQSAHRADLVEGKGEKVAEASESEEPESSEGRTACYVGNNWYKYQFSLWTKEVYN